jgi:hypothetical protein
MQMSLPRRQGNRYFLLGGPVDQAKDRSHPVRIHGHYPASTVQRTSLPPQGARPVLAGIGVGRDDLTVNDEVLHCETSNLSCDDREAEPGLPASSENA